MIRILFARRLQDLDGFFEVFPQILQVAEIVIDLEIVVPEGSGDKQPAVSLFGAVQLDRRKAIPHVDLEFVEIWIGAANLDENLVGLHRLLPGLFPVVEVGEGEQGIGILGILRQPPIGLPDDRVTILRAHLFLAGIPVLFSGNGNDEKYDNRKENSDNNQRKETRHGCKYAVPIKLCQGNVKTMGRLTILVPGY